MKETIRSICKNCYNPMFSLKHGTKFCSHKCNMSYYYRHTRKPKELKDRTPVKPRKCHNCGKSFTPNLNKTIYCTPKCYHKAYYLKH